MTRQGYRRIVGLSLLLFAPHLFAEAHDTAIVDAPAGAVHGTIERDVVAFKGIPFAAAPVGDLRWRPPRPVPRWAGTLDAKAFGPACMQTDDIPKSEDCLTLNIWRPVKATGKPMPVMVWIYGGALAHGNTAMYLGDGLARQGVIVVSMNYRMGRFGFFAFPALSDEAGSNPTANFGYLDQLAALRWVKANIAAFGGDPSQVTLFGQSAGGGSVLAHLASPMSKGLFARAILQSPGVPTARAASLPLVTLGEAQRSAVNYAESVGVHDRGFQGLCALRALSAEALLEGASAREVIAGLSSGKLPDGFPTAILDGKFLVRSADEALATGQWNKVPVMVGANSRDLGVGMAMTKEDLFALFGSRAEEARRLYDPHGTLMFDELKQQVLADKTLVEPARHLADMVAASGQPVWLYRFSYVAESQRSKLSGTPHSFEIPYTFNLPAALVGNAVTANDRSMATLASAYWVAFARSGDPNGPARPTWPPFGRNSSDRVFDFTNHGAAYGPDPLKARLDLWSSVYEGTGQGR
ncbi:carboxylesterase/lipase family protein [Cupriavidus numazuensis]|uniref:Carboxylic ester hydrolase n=1 Tax=Cupriavidus numazuensis TaxID=221992 RepID=A0ABM8TTN4_9BURK|nr:carboxylesterase family protein [Cupriavidus numazuensis]CAG2159842.1 Fumonisin B1 esterase [Cupriavidus numazuensis]